MSRLARVDAGANATYARELKIHSLRWRKENRNGFYPKYLGS